MSTRRRPGELPARLPVEPFGRWLTAYEELSGLSSTEVAVQLRIQPRRSQMYRFGSQASVAFDVVDTALTNASRIVELDGVPIYGIDDLYELDELAA